MKYNYFEITHIGKVRGNNEDFYGSAQTINGHVFIVCDGMGGHAAGEVASSLATKSVIYYLNAKKYDNPVIAIYGAIQFANQKILEEAASDTSRAGMGTTITLTLIIEENIYIAHVGDSRIYLLSDNKLIRLTSDHSFVQNLINQGVISEEEANHHPKKNQLSRALGVKENVEITLSNEPLHLKKGDQLLLCTDGLSGMVNDLTIHAIMTNKALTIEKKGQELINLANNAGGIDNITLSIVEILESSNKKSNYANYKISVKHAPKSPVSKPLKIITIVVFLFLAGGGIGALFYYHKPTDLKSKIVSIVIHKKPHATDSLSRASAISDSSAKKDSSKIIKTTPKAVPARKPNKSQSKSRTHQRKSKAHQSNKTKTHQSKTKFHYTIKDSLYTIERGDNLHKLSNKFGINISILKNEAKKTGCRGPKWILNKGKIIKIPLQYSWNKKLNPSTKYKKDDPKATHDYFMRNKHHK